MKEWFLEQSPIIQALLATTFTWGVTALGAASVFFVKKVKEKLMDFMLGFAGGVMIAASYWSLLSPAIEMAQDDNVLPAWLVAAIGFLLGGLFIFLLNKYMPHTHPSDKNGKKSGKQRSFLLVMAITLHNFPEGLAVGVAFGAVAAGYDTASLAGAIALAIGIGLQNFPEGVAVSMPLRRDGMSRTKSFMYGQSSALVEPVAGVIGAAAVGLMKPILPYALAFAAGAMIFVVAEEVIPGSQENGNKDLSAVSLMIGFTIMMTLDVALG
ncbi:ZIP family metal transporter [Pseudalkalibacillus caeni]|uniref:ZIP family metal transporter n=1 Tax=Exobacillus caeni TaxID=2574798 RepID=A0A5R9EZB8_9BACL|nr:ZIP family metal transporter [Pseudalkalibacillus caeni]TLS35440.1 ZIP family metal transporter [Pseudalkalibacillus caeni]